jgi:hypothetical protein
MGKLRHGMGRNRETPSLGGAGKEEVLVIFLFSVLG